MKGYVRGFDVRTGKRLWIFHTIPQPGEFGNDTWENDSWSYTGNTGVWGQISVDEELGMVYLPVELPTGDYYGGHRPGNGLFGESLVAVDLKTGKRKWHYQLVHHGIWDMDIPCAPILADITVNGRHDQGGRAADQAGLPLRVRSRRPASRSGRSRSGRWRRATCRASGIRRRSRFRPSRRPTTPGRFDRRSDRLHAGAARGGVKLVSNYKIGPIFTPPVVSKIDGPLATLFAARKRGTNWPGGSYDPETHTLYVFSRARSAPMAWFRRPDPKVSDMDYIQGNAATGAQSPRAARVRLHGGRRGPAAGGGGGEGGGGGLTVQGLAAGEAAVRPHHARSI